MKIVLDRVAGPAKVSLVFVAGVVAGTGHPAYLIPAVVGGAAVWLLWRGDSERTGEACRPGDKRASAAPPRTLEDSRLEILEGQVDTMRKEQAKLREALRWQEELLQQTTRGPVGR